jgi:hypothetical protein
MKSQMLFVLLSPDKYCISLVNEKHGIMLTPTFVKIGHIFLKVEMGQKTNTHTG